MALGKRAILIMLKTLLVLFIPYSWINIIYQSSPTQIHTEINEFIGTWGVLSPGESIFHFYFSPSPFWQESQLLFSFLFILPLIAFNLFFGQRILDRKCIAAAGVSVFLSHIMTYLLPLDYSRFYPYLVVPSVVSLAIFVFVFWPLMINSWPLPQDEEVFPKKRGIPSRLYSILNKVVPTNAATLVWVIMAAFPAFSSLTFYSDIETFIWYDLSISGGLSVFSYSYRWSAPNGNYYEITRAGIAYSTASWASATGLLFWTLSLWLGITTLRFVIGKSTKQRLLVLTTTAILIVVIPAATALMIGMGQYIIPLPFFPVAMLIMAKFAHAPTSEYPATEDVIEVPLRIRFLSKLRRRRKFPDGSNGEVTDDQVSGTDER